MTFDGEAGRGLEGTVLQGSFRLNRLIGQGGMGAVYEAIQLRLDKRVAVKLLARELTSNPEALARFRREAEVTSRLGHPHIVQVFDFGTAPWGEPYLVMEFLEGEDLDVRIRRAGQLSVQVTNHVIKQIASALSSTHARGIVHRDLKPANIFLLDVEGETDFVKIVDFGISKVRAASVRLTGESALIGTPSYMSPEQAMGQIVEIDHKTDQWSLACIAYEMLAGRGPFIGESTLSLLYQVTHEEPRPLGGLVANLPRDIERVVARALSKRRQDRFPTVAAFARAFATAMTSAASPLAEASARDGATKVFPPEPSDRKSAARRAPPAKVRWIAVAVGSGAALLAGGQIARSRYQVTAKPVEALVGSPAPVKVVPVIAPVIRLAPVPVAAPAITERPAAASAEPAAQRDNPASASAPGKSRRAVSRASSPHPKDTKDTTDAQNAQNPQERGSARNKTGLRDWAAPVPATSPVAVPPANAKPKRRLLDEL